MTSTAQSVTAFHMRGKRQSA